MLRNLLVVGGACAVLAGCADAPRGPTEPGDATLRFGASGTIAVSVPARGRVSFPASVRGEAPRGVSLSRVPPRVGTANGTGGSGAVLPLIAVRDGARGLLARPGEYRRVLSMRDESGRVHHLVALYDGSGGPPRAIQHYVGRTLVRVTAMEWERVRGGWAERRLVARELRHGALALEVDARADTLQVASSAGASSPSPSLFARARAGLLAALAYTFAPSEAQAQYYFSECWSEYTAYWKATAALTASILAIEVAVESGVGEVAMNALYFSYVSALALAVSAEMDLYMCVDNAREADQGGSTSSTSSTSDGSSGGASKPSADCLEGSYAAHCQTQFGL